MTAIEYADMLDHEEIRKLLGGEEKEPPKINEYQKEYELLDAVCDNYLERVKKAIENGADIYFKNYEGCNSFHIAAINGNVEILTILLENDYKKEGLLIEDSRRESLPMHIAIIQNHDKCLELILQTDQDMINKIDKKGLTPLELANKYRVKKCIKILQKYNSNNSK